jgi:capsular polysaccharide biosynthesis protein
MLVFPLSPQMSVPTYKLLGWIITILFVIATVIEIIILFRKKHLPCWMKKAEEVETKVDLE